MRSLKKLTVSLLLALALVLAACEEPEEENVDDDLGRAPVIVHNLG